MVSDPANSETSATHLTGSICQLHERWTGSANIQQLHLTTLEREDEQPALSSMGCENDMITACDKCNGRKKKKTPCKGHTNQLQSGAEQYTQQKGSGKCRLFQRGCIFRRPSDTTRNITSYTYLYIDLVFFHHSVVWKHRLRKQGEDFTLKVGHVDSHWVNSDCWCLITWSWVFAQDDWILSHHLQCSYDRISLRLVDREETTKQAKPLSTYMWTCE